MLRHRPIEWFIAIGFIIISLVFTLGVVSIYINNKKTIEDAKELWLSNRVLFQIESLKREVISIESYTRAYIITGNPEFSAVTTTTMDSAYRHADALRAMLNDEPRQLARLDSIMVLGDLATKGNLYIRNLIKEGKKDEAVKFIETGAVVTLTKQIETRADEMKAVEENAIPRVTQNLNSVQKLFSIGYIVRVVFLSSLLLGLYLLIRYYFRNLRKTEAELKEKISAMQELNKEMEIFTYSVAHDLRTPLRAISGFSNILQKKRSAGLDVEDKRMLHTLDESAQNMGELIDALLKYATVGQAKLSYKETNITALARETAEELKVAHPAIKAGFSFGSTRSIYCDQMLMKQVLQNLLGNALKYSSRVSSPIINFDSYKQNGEMIFFVKDNGAGFDMQYGDKLFSPFQRLHSEDGFEGTGIGLAIVQRIVQKHGGRVWADGKVNEGAIFYFSLPDKNDNDYVKN